MAGGGPRAAEAEDFLDFARTRQRTAFAGAALVTGDPLTADELTVEALARLAGDWGSAREAGPEAALRRALYPALVRTAERPAPEGEPLFVAEPPEPGPEDLDAALPHALGALAPAARAVAALRWVEEREPEEVAAVLGVSPSEVARHEEDVRRRLAPLLPVTGDAVTDDDLRLLLERVADRTEPATDDLAERAWRVAAGRRTRRRRVVLAGAAAAALAAGVAVVRAGQGSETTPAPGPSAAADGRVEEVLLRGARVALAPDRRAEGSLPPWPRAATLGLPGVVGLGSDRPLGTLSPAGSSARIRLVMLVRVDQSRYQPVVTLESGPEERLLVPMSPLRAVADRTGVQRLELGAETVAPERHRLVFAQPRAVVVVELRSARTVRFAVPDDHLVEAGWAPDGRTIVAHSAQADWLVDSADGSVLRAAPPVDASAVSLHASGGDAAVSVFTPGGRVRATRRIVGPPLALLGPSVADPDGWVCRAAFFSGSQEVAGRLQGLVVVPPSPGISPRLLAAPDDGVTRGVYRPLVWSGGTVVVLESRATRPGEGSRVLAWDVRGQRMFRVVDVEPATEGEDRAFTGAWTL